MEKNKNTKLRVNIYNQKRQSWAQLTLNGPLLF